MSFIASCSAPQVWDAALAQLLLRVTRQNYETWLRNTVGLRFEGTTLVVGTPNELACDWLATRMRSVIAQALCAVAGPGLQVRFEPVQSNTDLGSPAPVQPSMLPGPSTPINQRFIFRSYMEGEFNRLALTAARDLAENNESHYSPLFITAPPGMGKTHLLHATAHAASRAGTRVLLVSAEQFLSEFTQAVRTRTGAAFRARYRELDFLLVDDVHLLTGKRATLQEFYQTLASLHDQGKRIAVSGDASSMTAEASRFRNQLCWGLVATIGQPSVEDRVRFVHLKAKAQGMELPAEVEHYLALRVKSSIRDLEGAVNRVAAIARISDEPLTIDFAARALQAVTATPLAEQKPVEPTKVVQTVCNYLSLGPAELISSKRDRNLTYGRHIAMYLLRQDAGLTFSAIARLLNKKDHSTVVHACSQLEKQLPLSPELRADIDAIRARFHSDTTAA